MHIELLSYLTLFYGVGWVQTTGTHLFETPNFTLGLAVMRLLIHTTLLSVYGDRRIRAYNFYGLSICLLYLATASLDKTIGWAFTLESVSVPFILAFLLRRTYQNQLKPQPAESRTTSEQEQQLAFEQLKTRFFTNISHEFRTPLNLLLEPLDNLRKRFPANDQYASMHRNARRLLRLVNQLLDLARLDAGQLHPNPQPGNLVADVNVWVTSFEATAHSRGIHLSLQQNQPIWPARYDADKIREIVSNLLSNALKFTDREGQVQVQAVYETTGLTLRISDTGVGIPPDDLSTLFDRFYQAEPHPHPNAVAALYEGAGVGLTLVRKLVDLLQGSIGVASVVGAGTTFTVWLPLETDSVAVQAPDPATDSSPVISTEVTPSPVAARSAEFSLPRETSPTLLVVEDNNDLRTYIRTILAVHYTIREAIDGQQGLKIAQEWLPDLIVIDLTIANMDGLDFCRQLRSNARTDHIPVVLLTSKATLEDRLEVLENGADECLIKPFVPLELSVRLQNLLHRQRTIRAALQRELTHPTPPNIPPSVSLLDNLPAQYQAFIKNLYGIIDRELDNPHFNVEALALNVSMSSRSLNRKLNALLGLSAGEVIRTYRLRRAAELLRQGMSPTETSYRVGYESPSHFSRAFREHFRETPSTFADKG